MGETWLGRAAAPRKRISGERTSEALTKPQVSLTVLVSSTCYCKSGDQEVSPVAAKW